MMDIRAYLVGGKEKRSEKNTEKVHKRPNEEGKVPQSKWKFLPSWRLTFLGYTIEMGQCSAWCVRKGPIYQIRPRHLFHLWLCKFQVRFSEKPRRIRWTPESCRCHPNCSQPTRSSHPTGIETAEQRSRFKAWKTFRHSILCCKNGDAVYNVSSSLSTRRKACSWPRTDLQKW